MEDTGYKTLYPHILQFRIMGQPSSKKKIKLPKVNQNLGGCWNTQNQNFN